MTAVRGSAIAGIATYLPARVVNNDELAARTTVTSEWIEGRTGIRSRHHAAPGEDVTAMAVAAGTKAVAASSVDPAEIDLLVLATSTRMLRMPGAAPQVASLIGLGPAGAVDVNAVCAGFCYALALASNAVRLGEARNALVIGADRISGFLTPRRPDAFAIFGDGAGAVVVSASDEAGIGPVAWGSDGGRAGVLEMVNEEDGEFIAMNGPAVYKWSTSTMPHAARRACALAEVDIADISWFVPHQANLRIIDMLARSTGIAPERVSRDVVDMGNTSAASIPLALGQLSDSGRAQPGDLALLLGFGAGLTYAGQVVRLP
jgi:3-oxoacyl-[acyl-carrier-protein] synthase III